MAVTFPIVDAHVHFWDPRTTPRAVSIAGRLFLWNRWALHHVGIHLFPRSAREFIGDPRYILERYAPADYALDHDGIEVEGVIHVEAGWHGRGRTAAANETRWLETFGPRPILGIVGKASLDDPQLGRLLAAHAEASTRLVGIRDIVASDPDRGVMDYAADGRLLTPAFQAGLRAVADAGLTFDAWCYGPQLGALAQAVAAAPETRVALCHFGSPIGAGGPFAGYGGSGDARASIFARWKDDVSRLAEFPQVHAKLSGLSMPVLGFDFHRRTHPPTADELASRFGPFVEHVLAAFGPRRCFFASNFPIDKVSAPWSSIVSAYDALTEHLSTADRRALFRDNARTFYGV